jgi:hypothetical protein
MHDKKRWEVWVWYAVLVAVVTGLFAPTMLANAGVREIKLPVCVATERAL